MDFIPASGTFLFSSADTERSFRVTIINDGDTEGAEDFLGQLTTSEDRVDLAPDTTLIQILDDEGTVCYQDGRSSWLSLCMSIFLPQLLLLVFLTLSTMWTRATEMLHWRWALYPDLFKESLSCHLPPSILVAPMRQLVRGYS